MDVVTMAAAAYGHKPSGITQELTMPVFTVVDFLSRPPANSAVRMLSKPI